MPRDRTAVDAEDGVTVRPFADVLRELSRGVTHSEMSDKLRDLIGRVRDTGKPGTLTLTLKVERLKSGDGNVLVVTDKIVLREPQHDRKGSIFYATSDNNLTRENPDQLTFDSLKAVDVDTTTGEITGKKEKRA